MKYKNDSMQLSKCRAGPRAQHIGGADIFRIVFFNHLALAPALYKCFECITAAFYFYCYFDS